VRWLRKYFVGCEATGPKEVKGVEQAIRAPAITHQIQCRILVNLTSANSGSLSRVQRAEVISGEFRALHNHSVGHFIGVLTAAHIYKVVLEGDDALVDLAHNAAGEPQLFSSIF
jgi:hypothetical protein